MAERSASTSSIEKTLQWMPFVCQIQLPEKSGTGFLVAPNLIMTCAHVLQTAKKAENAYAHFPNSIRTKLNPDPASGGFFFSQPCHEDKVLSNEKFDEDHQDFAIVAIEPSEKLKDKVPFSIFQSTYPTQASIPQFEADANLLHHPMAEHNQQTGTILVLPLDQRASFKEKAVMRIGQFAIHFQSESFKGSSGAPVIDGNGKIYGLLHGQCNDNHDGHEKCKIALRFDQISRFILNNTWTVGARELQPEPQYSTQYASSHKHIDRVVNGSTITIDGNEIQMLISENDDPSSFKIGLQIPIDGRGKQLYISCNGKRHHLNCNGGDSCIGPFFTENLQGEESILIEPIKVKGIAGSPTTLESFFIAISALRGKRVIFHWPNDGTNYLQTAKKAFQSHLSFFERNNLDSLTSENEELLLVRECKEEAMQAIKEYEAGSLSFKEVKKRVDDAVQTYEEFANDLGSQSPRDEALKQRDALKKEWILSVFSYARKTCVSEESAYIKFFENSLRTTKVLTELESKLSKKLHKTKVDLENEAFDARSPEGQLKLRSDIKIEAKTEQNLFLFACLSELLNHREAAIQGYFLLANYQKIARKPDKFSQACIRKAQELENAGERATKETLVHEVFVQSLNTLKNSLSCSSFSCFISSDNDESIEEWVEDFLCKHLRLLGIRPISRASQRIGKHEVDYAKRIREEEVALILCDSEFRRKYEEYLMGRMDAAHLGIQLQFLKDRFESGKGLDNTYYILLKGNWKADPSSNLPDYFERKNYVSFWDKNESYIENLPYFKNALRFFCDLLEAPEDTKRSVCEEFSKNVSTILQRPLSEEDKKKASQFLKTLETLAYPSPPPAPLANSTVLIGVPEVGADFQPRDGLPLEALFIQTNLRVLTQDPSIICGTGKTYAAAQYIHKYSSKYSYVFWIDGSSQESINESFTKIIGKVQSRDSSITDLPSFLKWAEKISGTLFVYDNVQSPESLHGISLNDKSNGHTLVTSRYQEWDSSWSTTYLKLFTLEEGQMLLRSMTGKNEPSASREIVQSFGGIPSFLFQVGLNLKKSKTPPSGYKAFLNSELANMKRIIQNRGNISDIPEEFYERRHYLAAIHEAIVSDPFSTIILKGPQHIGKSYTARRYAFENARHFHLIWNLPCAEPKALQESVSKLASRCNVGYTNDLGATLSKIYQTISDKKEKTLIIFEELSSEKSNLLPIFSPGIHALVTTQDLNWNCVSHVFSVEPLKESEAPSFLQGLNENSLHLLSQNISLFKGNPLSLLIARQLINNLTLDPRTLIDALKREQSLNAIFSTLWRLAQELIIQKHGDSVGKKLIFAIKFCACSPSCSLSREELTEKAKIALEKEQPLQNGSPFHIGFRSDLTLVSDLALLKLSPEKISVHPLLSAAVIEMMSPEERCFYSQKP